MTGEQTAGSIARIPRSLLFDARYIRPGAPDGIGRFTRELGRAAAAAVPRGWRLLFLVSDPVQRRMLEDGGERRGGGSCCESQQASRVGFIAFHAPTSWREPFSALRLNRLHPVPDVLFSPMQTIGLGGRRFGAMLTLHDLIYYRHRTPPREFAAPIRLGWRLFYATYAPQRRVLNRADVVCTVSETSRRDIERARLTRRPIVVVRNAPSLPSSGSARRLGRGDRMELVYMGSFMGYKDVETLVRTAGILGEGYRLHLLSHVSPSREAELRAVAPAADLVFHHGVSDGEYARILSDRAVLVTASRDEGYGLPVAEALAAGAPAVVTDLPIFHEVADGGALYFPVGNAAAAAASIRSLREPAVWAAVTAAGREHIGQHTWAESASMLWSTAARIANARNLGNTRSRLIVE